MEQISQSKRLWRTFTRNRTSLAGLVLALVVTILAIAAPLIARHDPLEQSSAQRLKPPDATYLMGRDTYGRDIFARVLNAGRISLMVGVGSVLVGGVIGTLLGLIAGYSGGWLETAIMRCLDVLMAFPSLLLGLAVLAVLGPGLSKMILGIGLVLTPSFARIVHAQTLTIKHLEYVQAAQSLGAGQGRLLLVHILPGVLGEVVVMSSLLTASAIRIEASLSFIGLGVSAPTPTWGNMLREGIEFLNVAPWLAVFPATAILLTVLAFNLVGDGLRDVIDPRLR